MNNPRCFSNLTSNELGVLLLAVNGHDVSGLLRRDLDWHRLTKLAKQHELIPPLYKTLKLNPDHIPVAVLAALEQASLFCTHHSLKLVAELEQLVAQFKHEGVTFRLHKGVALAQLLYGDVAARVSKDIDIVVARTDLIRAKHLLQARGYVDAKGLQPQQERLLYQQANQQNFHQPAKAIFLELHWQFLPPYFQFSEDAFWSSPAQHSLGSVTVPTLALEQLLVVLCIHGAVHRYSRLKWLLDIAVLLQTQTLDFKKVAELAASSNAQRAVALSLNLADSIFAVRTPEDLLTRQRNSAQVKSLVDKVLADSYAESQDACSALDVSAFHFHMLEPGSRKRYIQHLLFEGEHMRYNLPEQLSSLYRVSRPVRLAFKYLRHYLSA